MSSVRELIDSSPMNRVQIRVLLVCLLCNMIEGYDILSMSIAVVPLSEQWALSGSQVGTLLAVGPVGMAVGSLVGGPLADRIGRRPMLLLSLAVTAVFIGLSATATDLSTLSGYRLLAGIGMGSVLPALAIITAEFAPARKRGFVLGVLSTGSGIGGAAGGAAAVLLMNTYEWTAVFLLGGALTAVMVVIGVVAIPETPDFLASRNTETARRKLAVVMEKMRLTGADKDPRAGRIPVDIVGGVTSKGANLRSAVMVMIGLAFMMGTTVMYFAQMWIPKLLVLAGMSANQGISGVLLVSLGSVAGGALLAVLSTRISPFVLVFAFTIAGGLMMGVFSLVSGNLVLAMVVAPLLGLCNQAIVVGVYTLVPALFGPENRTSAMGIGLGMGRLSMIVMPLLVGVMIDGGWNPEALFQIMVLPCVLLLLLIFGMQKFRNRPQRNAPDDASRAVLESHA
ncbi:MFS transporter [Rhodococcus opacus]|nr:MFS transporter [Rhodococcus opacus]